MSWWWIVLAAVRPGPVEAVVATARSYVGTPYVYGGASHEGVDCSGLVMIVYTSHGVSMPRTAADQARMGAVVPPRHVAPGDLLFFSHEPGTGRVEHVGVAVDAGHMIHASTSRHQVVVDSIDSPYFQERLVAVRRLLPAPPPTRVASTAHTPVASGKHGAAPPPTRVASTRKTAATAAREASAAKGGASRKSVRATRAVEKRAGTPGPSVRKAPGERSTQPRASTAGRAKVGNSAPRHARCAPAKAGKGQRCLSRKTRSASERRK